MSRIITFKSKLNKSGNHFYIYIPRCWNEELHEIYRKRKRVVVTIEIKDVWGGRVAGAYSIEDLGGGIKNKGNGRIQVEYISKRLRHELWERIKEEILRSFRRPEWREIVRLTLENPWILDWARDFGEYKYYLRGVIACYIEKGINREFYEKLYRMLMDQKALEYLEQTILVKLVEWGIISRPDTRGEGAIYYLYEWYNIEKLMEIDISRFRGIIYVEKKSAAEEIAGELYAVGFLTAYGKGYPTWKMRLAAQQGKLYVYCDADWAGRHIFKVFAEGAERLKRISRSVCRETSC